MFISFSGIDSAGKSTQINMLKAHFIKQNKKVRIVWSRGGYTYFFNTIKKIARFFLPRSMPKPGHSEKRNKAFQNHYVSSLWINIALVELIILYGLFFRLLKLVGYIVIADRYIWDTFIDFKLRFKEVEIEKLLLWKILSIISVLPDHSFIITIPVEESLRRSNLKNEPFSESLAEREQRINKYNGLILLNKWKINIDGMVSIDEAWSVIKRELV